MQDIYTQTQTRSNIQVNQVLRNTYMLLAMTLLFSALCAGLAMAAGIGIVAGFVCSLAAFALIWLALPRTANSASGLVVVFAFTGLIGAGLGPIINYYLSTTNGTSIVFQALAGTALTFFGLSAYALISRKNFNFLHGFITVGIIVILVGVLGSIVASFFGIHVTALEMVFSAGIILVMSALILYQTSEIIHGGETNYLLATTSLYLSIINIFTSLLHLLGASDE